MTTSSSAPAARSWKGRRVLIALAVALGIGEFMGALSIDWPAGILFLAGAYWIYRGGMGGLILVGVLAAIEAVAVPVHGPYADWAQDSWIVQTLFVVVSLTAVITAIAILVASTRGPTSRQSGFLGSSVRTIRGAGKSSERTSVIVGKSDDPPPRGS